MNTRPYLLYGHPDPYHRPPCPITQQKLIRERFALALADNLGDGTGPSITKLSHALNAALCEVWRTGAEFQIERGGVRE